MYRRYYSYNDMPQIPNMGKTEIAKEEPAPPVHNTEAPQKQNDSIISDGKLLGKFELDDIILIVIALALFFDDCDDKILLLAIGFIFLTGLLD